MIRREITGWQAQYIEQSVNPEYKTDKGIEKYVAVLESQFLILAAMGTTVREAMRIAILLETLSKFTVLSPIFEELNMMQESMKACNYITTLFIEESSILTQLWTTGNGAACQDQTGTLAALVRRGIRRKIVQSVPI